MYYSRYDIVWNTSDIKFVLYRQDNFLYYQIRIVQVGYIFILSNSYCTGEIHFLYYQIRIVQVGYIFYIIKFILYSQDNFSYYQIRIVQVGYIFILSNSYCTGGIHFHIIKFILYRWDTFSWLWCFVQMIFGEYLQFFLTQVENSYWTSCIIIILFVEWKGVKLFLHWRVDDESQNVVCI